MTMTFVIGVIRSRKADKQTGESICDTFNRERGVVDVNNEFIRLR
jgi:hypothetical protein